MADPPAPSPELDEQSGPGVLTAISRETVRAMKQYYGKGPVSAKSYLMDDLLFVVMRDGLTMGEETLLDAGEPDTVRAFRQRFENVMTTRLIATIEQLTGRKVLTYQSQIMFDPHVVVEMFVFDRAVSREAAQETADSMLEPDSTDG
jgi:uncharacterized protein YbcI